MCGIVGLFLKSPDLEKSLGALLAPMLVEMTERGPDSAGIAVYGNDGQAEMTKLTVLAESADYAWEKLGAELISVFGSDSSLKVVSNHGVLTVKASTETVHGWLQNDHPELGINSSGHSIEIYKEKGLPVDVIRKFHLEDMQGTHALGHTRMATESGVTTEHSHPFATGEDLCLVHNGSIHNHNSLRQYLKTQGVQFQTDNDSEVAAGYLTWKMQNGATLDEALEAGFEDLDGFYTFAVGTRDGFAVVRDAIGAKPAILAETDEWVAMASEFRSIATLPGVANARIWEPEPARIYSWHRS